MKNTWERPDSVLAHRFMKNELGGIFSKKVTIKDNEFAVIEKDGQIFEKIGPGTHTIAGLMEKELTEVVFVDTSIKSLKEHVPDVWTRDDRKINAKVDLRFRIYEPKKFIKNVLKAMNEIDTEELWEDIVTEVLSKAIIPEIRKRGIDELYGNREFLTSLETSFTVNLKKMLDIWGMELISLSLLWEFPPEYESFLNQRAAVKERAQLDDIEHKEALKKAFRDQEIESISKKGSDLEKKVAEKEVDLELEKKEMQHDVDEAIEAMRLKELKEKKKMLAELERKKLGLKENSE